MTDLEIVSTQLGRPAVGFQDVMRRRKDGTPLVARVALVVSQQPFPTLFWLTDPESNQVIGKLESNGWLAELQATIDQDRELENQLLKDQRRFIELRQSYLTREEEKHLVDLNCLESFLEKGVGGVANLSRIRCLHAWFAAHLVVENEVGKRIIKQLFHSNRAFLDSLHDTPQDRTPN